MWRFLLLRNATEPAAAPRPSSSTIDLSFLWNKPVHVSGQFQCQTALTSGGPTVNEAKSVLMQRYSLVSAGYRDAVVAVRWPPLVIVKLGLLLKAEMWQAGISEVACDSWRPSGPSIPSTTSSLLLGWGACPVVFISIWCLQGYFAFHCNL